MQEMIMPVYINSPHLSPKKISIDIRECDKKEVEVISCLLQNTPSLETLEIYQLDGEDSDYDEDYDYHENKFLKFLKDIRFLMRESVVARIIVLNSSSQPIHVLGCMPTPTVSM